MGVTIRITGTLRDQWAVVDAVKLAEEFAEWKDWSVDQYVQEDGQHHGIVLLPHETCDPVRLIFDSELKIDTEINTQFAGPDVHIAIVDLLRSLDEQFDQLSVSDDGGYWEQQDREQLESVIDETQVIIDALHVDDPGGQMMVRREDGRIVDFVNSEGQSICVSRNATDDSDAPMIDVDDLQERADAGDAEAQLQLGRCYSTGDFVTRNARTAVQYLKLSAAQSCLDAVEELADCYRAGTGVEQDVGRASELYQEGANQNHASCQSSLGFCYFNGDGVDQDYDDALHWFRAAAEHEDVYGLRMLGLCHADGEGIEANAEEAIAYFKRAADQGDRISQFRLGEAYRKGDGVPPDYAEAIRWYGLAAEQEHETAQERLRGDDENEFSDDDDAEDFIDDANAGHPHAQFRLAECYWDGQGVEEDEELAYTWLRRAAEQQHAEAQLLLGVFYWRGIHVDENHDEAFLWFQRAADQGHAGAMRRVAEWLLDEDAAGPHDPQRAHEYLIQSAKQGNGGAYLVLGNCHFYGLSTPVDPVKAVEGYRRAAAQGLVEALVRLGKCLLDGIGCEQDEATGVGGLMEAAESDEREAQNIVGQCYLQGRGVRRNEQTAQSWFERSASEGDAEGQFQLGCLYEVPRTRAPDFTAAVDWYTKAAKQSHAAATASLGRCLFFGRGAPRDPSRAFRLFHQTAGKGDAQAQYWLGVCYEYGIGCDANIKPAARSYDTAARQGHAVAQTKLAEFYLTGRAVAPNLDYARRWLDFAVSHGNAMAMVMMGSLVESESKAKDYFSRAAQFGFAFDESSLDQMPPGLQANEVSTPWDWFRKLAEHGDEVALNNLAFCCLDGIGVELDPAKAVQCFADASRQGSLVAQENLARCYQKGVGLDPDCEKAVRLHQSAADRGDVRAKYSLGQCYRFGRGVEKDAGQARQLIHEAAEAGHPPAMLAMGEMIEASASNARELESALLYFRRAVDADQQDAQPAARRIGMRLRQDDSFVPTAVIPDTLEDIGDDLLPVVRPLSFFEFNGLRLKIRGTEAAENWPYQELADHLGVGLVYDLPRAMQHVMRDHIDAWGSSLYECLERARDNLREMCDLEFSRINDQVFLCSMSDDYDPSRLLLEDEIRELPVTGKPIAMVPNVNHLFVCGSDDDEALGLMISLVDATLEDSSVRQISRLAYCLHAEGWSPWLPDADFACHEDLRRLWLQHFDQLYAEQSDLLERLDVHAQVRIAKFMSRTNSQTKRLESFCQWPIGDEQQVLLPKTDVIQFVKPSADGVVQKVVGEATWDQVENAAGELLHVMDEYPERLRAASYPSDGPFLQPTTPAGFKEELLVADDAQSVSEVASHGQSPSSGDTLRSATRQFKTTRCNIYEHAEFVLEVDASDEKAIAEAPRMIEGLEDMVAEGSQLQPGQTFRYGWIVLMIEQWGEDCLTLHEPDMRTWPIHYVPGVTNTVKQVPAQFAAVGSVANLPQRPSVTTMKHEVTVCKTIGQTKDVLMQRQAFKQPEHSGWMIECFDGDHDHTDADAHEVITLYEAFLREPLIVDFLAFPIDTTVNLVDGKLNILESGNTEFILKPGSYLDTCYETAPPEHIDWEDDDDEEDELDEFDGLDLDGEDADLEADVLVLKAIKLHDAEEYEEAIELLNGAVEINPEDSDVYHVRGLCYSELGQHDNALADFDRAIEFATELDDDESDLFAARSQAHHALGRLEDALADCERALELSPDDPTIQHNRAYYQKELGRYDEALENFLQIVQDDAENADALNEIACIMVARDDVENRDAAGAIAFAERACELTLWDDACQLDTLAAALAGVGQFEDAVQWQSKAVELASEDEQLGMRFRLGLYKKRETLRMTSEFPFSN